MEPPSSRSRPLVSRMSRRCHTHLMWFLAGAAAALSRLIAVHGALQTDNPAPRCPRTPASASPALAAVPKRCSNSPRDARAPPGRSRPGCRGGDAVRSGWFGVQH